jgi:hypothetical protein
MGFLWNWKHDGDRMAAVAAELNPVVRGIADEREDMPAASVAVAVLVFSPCAGQRLSHQRPPDSFMAQRGGTLEKLI